VKLITSFKPGTLHRSLLFDDNLSILVL